MLTVFDSLTMGSVLVGHAARVGLQSTANKLAVAPGDRLEVHLNGFEILNANLAEVRENPLDGKEHPGAARTNGHFGFCGHNEPVEFRNIRVKRL